MAQSQESRNKNRERIMHEIWDAWDFHLFEKLESADRLIRHMVSEFKQNCVADEVWRPFLQQMVADQVDQIAENAERAIHLQRAAAKTNRIENEKRDTVGAKAHKRREVKRA